MVIHYMSLIIRWQLAKTSYSQQSYPFFLTLLCFGAFHFWNADAATFRASKIRKPWVSLGWWSFAFDAQDEGALYEVGFSLLWSFMKPPDGSGGHRGHWLVLRNTIVWHRTRLGYPSNWPPDRFCCSNRRLWWVCHWTLSGCWFQTCFIFHFIYGMSSFPLTNSYFSRWAHCTTNQRFAETLVSGMGQEKLQFHCPGVEAIPIDWAQNWIKENSSAWWWLEHEFSWLIFLLNLWLIYG